ncbi:bile acid:sodium symporter [Nocardioides zeae]|uniref:Bile acid:sodium symporter n=1 Tax=Nocardioides imazamoxiresistens TaxID=3231893 RepID=A0ABU3Q1L3_9ACTN|nr:bile acid:sodium symporter [Nocardioides zeae]MDT9595402.1 bile acid:sodium symporter [Nocardioides zeae]
MTDSAGDAREDLVARMERHQVLLYLAAIAVGVAVGRLVPGAGALDVAITPVLALLLFATFLAVPFASVAASLRDARFLLALAVLNFVVVPVVVLGLSRVVAGDRVLLVGVLLVLLAPCIDYVIVFTRLAGGAAERLLAAAPLLMAAQVLALPAYLWLLAGPDVAAAVEVGPFVEALLVLVVAPLGAAVLVQVAARRQHQRPTARAARAVGSTALAAMVPLMMATLAVVPASQVGAVGADDLGGLATVALLFVAFLVVMAPLGRLVARAARLDVPAARALTFSGATRNSLVVLPLALALPDAYALAALVVVTQTLVELVGMVLYVVLVPRLVR